MSKKKRNIIDAKPCPITGNIEWYKLEGNTTFTNRRKTLELEKRGDLNAVGVYSSHAADHIRQPPDSSTKNNLGHLADD